MTDYIFDWARDIYRSAILRQLHELSDLGGERRTLNTESEIASHVPQRDQRGGNSAHGSSLPSSFWFHDTRNQGHSFNQNISASQNPILHRFLDSQRSQPPNSHQYADREAREQPILSQRAVRGRFDSDEGVARDAAVIKTRCFGLLINESNAKQVVDSIAPQEDLSTFLRASFQAYDRHILWFEHERDIHNLEICWTGHSRMSNLSLDTQSEVYAKICISYYLTNDWELVRELAYIAISRKALKVLDEQIGDKSYSLFCLSENLGTLVGSDDVANLCWNVQRQTKLHHLQAAIARSQLVISSTGGERRPKRGGHASSNVELVKDERNGIRSVVFNVYRRCKIGNRELEENSLCYHEVLHKLSNDNAAPCYSLRFSLRLVLHDFVCVYGKQKGTKPAGPNLGLFQMKERNTSMTAYDLAEVLRYARRRRIVYFTIPEGKTLIEVQTKQRNREDKVLWEQQKEKDAGKSVVELTQWINNLAGRSRSSRSNSPSRTSSRIPSPFGHANDYPSGQSRFSREYTVPPTLYSQLGSRLTHSTTPSHPRRLSRDRSSTSHSRGWRSRGRSAAVSESTRLSRRSPSPLRYAAPTVEDDDSSMES